MSHWLQSALDRLEFWTTQSVTVPQELETVRDHLCAFLVSWVILSIQKMSNIPINIDAPCSEDLTEYFVEVSVRWIFCLLGVF